jgi:dTDP-4-dehydrorhamnose reductase
MSAEVDIQVFGSSGMLGQSVIRALERRGIRYEATRGDILLLSERDIRAPTVINCAGITHPSALPSTLFAVNTAGSIHLSRLCDSVRSRLVYISTDAIFSSPGPHFEDDPPSPQTVYARSKLYGEITYPPHVTLRGSFVGRGKGVVEDLLLGKEVRVSRNALWSGMWVDEFAELIVDVACRPEITGLLHVPGHGQSRIDLVTFLKSRLRSRSPLIVDDTVVWDRRLQSHFWSSYGLRVPGPFSEQFDRWEKR